VDYSVVDDGRLQPVRGRAARSSCSHQLWSQYGLWETRRDEERLLYVYRRIRGDVCRPVLPAQKKREVAKCAEGRRKKKRRRERDRVSDTEKKRQKTTTHICRRLG
jgi:hypothetical protein